MVLRSQTRIKVIKIPQPPRICQEKRIRYVRKVINEPTILTRTRRIFIPKPYYAVKVIHVPRIIWDRRILKQKEFTYHPYHIREPLIIRRKRVITIPRTVEIKKLCNQKPMYLYLPKTCNFDADGGDFELQRHLNYNNFNKNLSYYNPRYNRNMDEFSWRDSQCLDSEGRQFGYTRESFGVGGMQNYIDNEYNTQQYDNSSFWSYDSQSEWDNNIWQPQHFQYYAA